MNANRCEIDFTNNSPLRNVFSGKRAGDRVELKVKMRMVSQDENGAVLDIVKIIAPNIDPVGEHVGDDEGATPDSREPAMIVMRGNNKGDASY